MAADWNEEKPDDEDSDDSDEDSDDEDSDADDFDEDDSDEDDSDDENPGESDLNSDAAGVETTPCPYCGGAVYEESEVCTHCGSYISEEDTPVRKPLWIVIAVATAVAAMLWWAL